MSGKLGEIEDRIAATHQLDAVIGAMRGIAASRSHEAHARLAGIRAAAATAGAAIGEVLAFVPDRATAGDPADGDTEDGGDVCIVVGTEQGFVGALDDELVAHARRRRDARERRWLLVGSRLGSVAAAQGIAGTSFAPMAAHPAGIPPLARRLTDALYARIADGPRATRVSVVGALPGEQRVRIAERTLVPFDLTRFEVSHRAEPPLVNLTPARLLTGLVEFYVFVELCEALMLSFAAENEARVRAMLAARANVQQRLATLTQRYRAMRQDEITSEIVELSTGGEAARRNGTRACARPVEP
ncbi:MAG TPA: FoF1 ATP synthase subunit gamma [Paraburkholderia sp.]|jgi:F-type H+-transporting ATPase subunit gamma|nr:FoF1 ATP synthase subunit gamma [Paraburkholderia sp.]